MMRYYLFLLSMWLCPVGAEPLYQENYDSLIEIGDYAFVSEIADTPEKMQQGMMYRPSIADNQAMIFVYPRPQRMSFWMKNTLIPLDMLFFDPQGFLLEIKHKVPPCKTVMCPTYPSQHANIRYVVELKGGMAKQLNLQLGDKLNGCGI